MRTQVTKILARSAALAAGAAGLSGCVRASVDPIEVKPIHITMDVNIRVQKELDQFFAFEDKLLTGGGAPAPAATQPRSDARN